MREGRPCEGIGVGVGWQGERLMCGIAGVFHYGEPERFVDREALLRMTRLLVHRGPDDEDFHFDGPLGLGHRRLEILDLSPTGRQPMPTQDGRCWISYNGEFYNHRKFRDELKGKGYVFRGTSDTETMLQLIRDRGPDCLRDAAAIFSLAFWDAQKQFLVLARDPLGVKQLYYHDDGKRIVFASEIKALFEYAGVPREPDSAGINQYLHFHSTLFDRTFFKDIRQLRAGEYIQISRQGPRHHTYWRASDFHHRGAPAEVQVDELRQKLSDVVQEQLMSDVPLGLFFSGGIDSSAVAAFAASTGKSPLCFGVHFSGQGIIDERPYQEMVAKRLGLRLHLMTMDGASFAEDLMRLMYHQDQPVIGHAMFPMYYVSQLASRHVKVCLGGQAGDEIFGGYARYALVKPWDVLKSATFGAKFSASNDGSLAPEACVGGNLWKQLLDIKILRRLSRLAASAGDWKTSYFNNFAKVPERYWLEIFLEKDLVSRKAAFGLFQETLERSPADDPVDKIMHWDMQTYLAGLFHQDDRMSMANSLESRVPLADPRLVQFAFQTDFQFKFRNGATKWILRQAIADKFPGEVLNRRKVGFDTPVEAWMKGRQSDFIRDLLFSSAARNRGIFNCGNLERIFRQPAHSHWFNVVWKAVCIESWARIFLDRKYPSPPPPVSRLPLSGQLV